MTLPEAEEALDGYALECATLYAFHHSFPDVSAYLPALHALTLQVGYRHRRRLFRHFTTRVSDHWESTE